MNSEKIDSKMFEICQEILNLKYINPINQASEKKKFFSSNNYNPKFKFIPPHQKLKQYKKQLRNFKKELWGEDEILFRKKAKKLILWINILEGVGKSGFTQNSIKYYSKPSPKLVKVARKLLRLKEEKENKNLTSKEVAEILNREIQKYEGWSSKEAPNLGSRIDDVTMEKTLYVKTGEMFSKEDIKRLIVHEIGVHTQRAFNGEKQKYKIFNYGTANYERTEEGLAVYMEYKNNLLSNSTLKNYGGRVLAISLALKKSFRETFNFLRNYFSDDDAYHLTSRAKRGLNDTSKSGAFTKDLIYLQGFLRLKEHLEKNPEDLEKLFIGRIDLEDLEKIKELLPTP